MPQFTVIPRRYCVRCGKRVENGLIINGKCINCFLEENVSSYIGESSIQITVCKVCGKIKDGTVWREWKEEDWSSYARRYFLRLLEKPLSRYGISLSLNRTKFDDKSVSATISIKQAGKTGSFTLTMPLVFKYEICPSCVKKRSGYHNAIVQIRSTYFDFKALNNILENTLSSAPHRIVDSIVEIDEKRGGIDIKMIDQGSARLLASYISKKYPSEISYSYKLIGERHGEKIYRLTISIRILEQNEEWILGELGDRVILYKLHKNKQVEIRDVSAGRTYLKEQEVLKKIRPFRGPFKFVTIIGASPDFYYAVSRDYEYFNIPKDKSLGPLKIGSEALLISLKEGDFIISKRLVKNL